MFQTPALIQTEKCELCPLQKIGGDISLGYWEGRNISE
jgi:hypothetical protein